MSFWLCSERWLTTGTEYAVPEKLPLPRKWYNDWESAATNGATGNGAGGTDVDESGECSTFFGFLLLPEGKPWNTGPLQLMTDESREA
jgi:hypothetical protein